MRKIIVLWAFCLLFVSCNAKTIDATTPQSFDMSVRSMRSSLDENVQKDFTKDIVLIINATFRNPGVVGSDKLPQNYLRNRLMHGKNFEQIRLLADSIRERVIIDLQTRRSAHAETQAKLVGLKIVSADLSPVLRNYPKDPLSVVLKIKNSTNQSITQCTIKLTAFLENDPKNPSKELLDHQFAWPLIPNKDTVITKELVFSRLWNLPLDYDRMKFKAETVQFADIDKRVTRETFDESDERILREYIKDREHRDKEKSNHSQK